MQFTVSALLAAAAFMPSALAHYNFDKLIVDGNVTEAYEYIRRMTNSNSPVTDVTSTDMRCNVGTQANAAATKTYPVTAGSEVGFTVADSIGHPGPLQVYMSKATGDVSEYDGSGDWFKVYELGTSSITDQGLQWASNGLKNFTFTLPSELPDGQYLLRAEHVALHGASTVGGAQYYISCAQIEVSGGSGGSPSPVVSIPGVYTGEEPGLLINIYWPIPTNYTMPGPAVWPAGSGSGSGSGSSSVAPIATTAPSSSAVATSAAVETSAVETSVAETSAVETAPVASSAITTSAAIPTSAVATSVPTTAPSSFVTSVRASATVPVSIPVATSAAATAPASTGGASGTVKQYYQCGGNGYTGATQCESGLVCKQWNDYYSQCVNA